ncbi:hypothetical protein FACS1894163_05620 [Spirochaetia bacterium]|nr:hypothetical protein FACS1894163_05620 [Spirochaetia bacterium]
MPAVLIVDDEKNIRAGIRKILSESIPGLTFLEAKNGIEALELAIKENPAVLVTDIRMPRMDGIALMAALREKMPDNCPEIIVLSGYDDFEYARKALVYQADSYILKPVDKNELLAAVSGAVREAEKTRKNLVEKTVRKFITEGKIPRDFSPLVLTQKMPACFVLFILSSHEASKRLEVFLDDPDCYRLLQNEFSLLVLLHGDGSSLAARFRDPGITAAVSGNAENFLMLAASFREARIAGWNRFFLKKTGGGVSVYTKPERPLNYAHADTLLQRLAGSMGLAETGTVKERLEELFSFRDIPSENFGEYCFSLNEWLVSQTLAPWWNYTARDMYLSMKKSMLETPERFASFAEWKKHFSDFILYLHALMKKQKPRYAFISEALAWIETHFSDDINMAMAANQVSVNYTWFSEKFSEQTGLHFNEYLKRLRIEKAKAILESGNYMVYEAAELSGYQDVKYFQKAFKEVTGLSPGEWRRKNQ